MNINWEFWIGDVGIPIATFVVGLLAGKTYEKRRINKASAKGNYNTIIQNSKINK